MTRSITIGGVERADLTRLESFSFQESAYRGEAGTGGFDVDSDLGAITVSAWKNIVAIDSDGGQFYTGQSVDRGVGRGPFREDSSARWDVQTIDINTIFDDVLLRGADCNRPDETDVERMTWLITDFLPGTGLTIGTDYLLTTDPEDVDAEDYRKQGVYPRSVADACAENSGKNWYLFYDVGVTDQLQIWYGRESDLARTCDYGISSVLDDIDDYGVVWAAEWPEESGLALDPSRVYSAVQVVYGDPPVQTFVNRPATQAAFKKRQAILFDSSVKKESTAIKLGEHYLDAAETEDATITVAVTVPTTHVNAFQHGQRIPIRAPHLGYDDPTYMRCRTRTIEPAGSEGKNPGLYRVTLVLKPSTKVTRFGGRPRNDVPGQGDNPPTDTGGTPAETEDVGCDTPSQSSLEYEDSHTYGGDGVGVKSFGGSAYVSSTVYYNVAWPVAGCPIGGGGWVGWHDEEQWYTYTAPADDPKYLGTVVTIDATGIGWIGPLSFPVDVRAASGAVTSGRFGDGVGLGSISDGAVVTFYVPRSAILWGGTNSIILAPSWQCERGAFFCDPAAVFNGPDFFGWGNSASVSGFSVSDVCVRQFVAGATGSSGWVAGIGDVDGENGTFTLIDWSGTGTVEASINGLIQPNAEVTLDTGAFTATIPPPPANAIVLFLYNVTA